MSCSPVASPHNYATRGPAVHLRAYVLWVLAVLYGLSPTQLQAAFDTTGYQWQAPLTSPAAEGFVALQVTPEIFDRSRADLADLRILDPTHNLVPHIVAWSNPVASAHVEQRNITLINATYQPKQFARVTLDFGQPTAKTEIQVGVPGHNFRRKAAIEGSTDSQSWEMIADNLWLFDVTLPGRSFKADTLRFPANNFRYLRLTVYNMPDDPERVTIDQVTAGFVEQTTAPLNTILVRKPASEKQDEKLKQTTWEFDLSSRNLPVASVQFAFTDPFFHRAYELTGRNSTTETVQQNTETGVRAHESDTPWESVSSGVLYRVVEADNASRDATDISVTGTPARYLRLTIMNQDDAPLHLDQLLAHVGDARLMFSAKPGTALTLVGGNLSAGPPAFDLPNAVRNLDPTKMPAASTGSLSELKGTVALVPWTERHGILLLLLLVACAGAMLALVANSLRTLQKPPQP